MRLASYDTLLAGTRAIKVVDCPLQNTTAEDGNPKSVSIGLRCLLGQEQVEVYERANRYAKEHGGKEADNDCPIWCLASSVFLLAVSAVDPDSDPSNPRPFFGEGENPSVEERARHILSSRLIGRDTIAYLAEQQELFQDETNPQIRKVSPDDMLKMVGEVVAEGARPFLRWGPALRLSFMVFMANQLWDSLMPKLESGSSTSSEASASDEHS